MTQGGGAASKECCCGMGQSTSRGVQGPVQHEQREGGESIARKQRSRWGREGEGRRRIRLDIVGL